MSNQLIFKKATKSLVKAKIALTGPSGAGKTLSSLYLAKGLGLKVAVLDTENNSASLYENRFPGWEYFVLPMNPPYTAQKYIAGIDAAIQQGFDVLIIDSLSHVWAAEGGLLQQKEALDSRGGNSYTNWGSITKLYEQLKSKILFSPIHMIVTMRSKQEYIMEQNDKGKQAPKKVGLAPIMRDGMEYEFTVVFDVGMDHQFMVSKDRTDLFDGVVSTINEQTGIDIKNWLATAPPPQPPPPEEPPPAPENEKQEFPPDDVQSHQPVENQSQEPPKRGGKAKAKGPSDYLINFGEHQGKTLLQIPEAEMKKLYQWTESQMKVTPPVQGISEIVVANGQIKAFLKEVGAWPINHAPK